MLFFGLLILLGDISRCAPQSENGQQAITCYNYDGAEYSPNYQCAGSFICCGSLSICDPNRFCKANGTLIRPTCSVFPWTDQDCSPLCKYGSPNGFLPRVITCPDGSFCCDNNPQCCSNHTGIVLDGLGGIVSSEVPISSTSSSSSSSASATSTSVASANSAIASTTSSSQPSSTPVPSGLSSGAKTGIGVGIAVGALLVLTLLFVAFHYRKRLHWLESTRRGNNAGSGSRTDEPKRELDAPIQPPPHQEYRYEMPPSAIVPELPQEDTPTELAAGRL